MFPRRILIELALLALYAILAGIVSSRLAVGAIAEQSPTQQPRRLAATRTIAITVEDASCDGACEGSLTIVCTTSSDAVSSDVLIIPASDFERVSRDLGCQSRAE